MATRRREGSFEETKCHVCEGRAFVWGSVRNAQSFVPGETILKQLKVWVGEKLRGRRCQRCGNVQLFVVPPK